MVVKQNILPALPYLSCQGKLSSNVLARPPNVTIGSRQGQVSHSPALLAGSPTPTTPEPAPMCCPGKVQGPLSPVLQLVRGRENSSTFRSPGPAFPAGPAASGERGGRKSLLCPAIAGEMSGGQDLLHSYPWGQLPTTPQIMTSSSTELLKGCAGPLFPESCSWLGVGSALWHSCPQNQLSQDAQARVGANSVQPRPVTSGWLLVVTDTCCCRATNPDVAPGGSAGQDPTMFF